MKHHKENLMQAIITTSPSPRRSQTKKDRLIAAKAGFTLIEVLVVITLIALIAGGVAFNLIQQAEAKKIDIARTNIRVMEGAVDYFKLEVGRYPTDLNELVSPAAETGIVSILKRMEKDPWKHDYAYEYPAPNGGYLIKSYGPDGQEGGDDDITNQDETDA